MFGVTFMVLAPESELVEAVTTDEQRAAVAQYLDQVKKRTERERIINKTVSGVFTGAYAVNPLTGEDIPVWVSDYVLAGYGTGAIMAVPAHDTRDFEFAERFQIPVIAVVDPGDAPGVDREAVLAGRQCCTEDGVAVNSGKYDGLKTAAFKQKISDDLAAAGLGREAVNYKLRDWLFSRQRFWGEPFPILHELDEQGQPTGCLRAVPDDELPVDLPPLDDFKPHGRPEPPLAKAPEEWLYPEIDGRTYRRETNTMPQWAGSCWYYLRFIDPLNDQAFVDPAKEKAWMPVDLYVGGAEHAVLHLLYARFWHKVLFDRGYVSTAEPFQRLVNQGMILGEMEFTTYRRPDGSAVGANRVRRSPEGFLIDQETGERVTEAKVEPEAAEKQGESFVLKSDPAIRIESRAYKMSKSRGNVVNPDEIVRDYGADSLRLYEMFMGPLEAVKPWSMAGVSGVRNFLDRVWRMIVDDRSETAALHPAVQDVEPNEEQNRMLHRTIMEVTEDTARMEFNTAIARMMEFTNFFTRQEIRPKSAMQRLVLLLSPFAPHIAEELWQVLGHEQTLAYEPWPSYDEALTKEDTIEVPVQVKGKLRGRIRVPAQATAEELEAAARADSRVAEWIEGKEIVKVVVVPGRMVNFVVK